MPPALALAGAALSLTSALVVAVFGARAAVENQVPARGGVLALAMLAASAGAVAGALWARRAPAPRVARVAAWAVVAWWAPAVALLSVRAAWPAEREWLFLALLALTGVGVERTVARALLLGTPGSPPATPALALAPQRDGTAPDGTAPQADGTAPDQPPEAPTVAPASGPGAWLGRAARASWLPLLVVVLACVAAAAYLGWGTTLQHARRMTATSDLGEFDNLFFNVAHGFTSRAPMIDGDTSAWGGLKVHFELVIFLLAPLYRLAPGPETLLWMQAVFVAATPVPLYLALRGALGPWGAVVPALAYLLLPAVQRATFYDFHFPPIGAFFAAVTVWALGASPRAWPVAVAAVLACASREEIALGLGVFALVGALTGAAGSAGTRRRWWAVAALGVAWFVLAKFVVMPRFGTTWHADIYKALMAPGEPGFGAVVSTLLTNPVYALHRSLTPEKVTYLLHAAAPLACLWLRRGRALALVASAVPFTLLVTDRVAMSLASYQYVFFWAPWVIVGSAWVLAELAPTARRAALVALALTSVLACRQLGVLLGGDHLVGGPVTKVLRVLPAERAAMDDLRSLVQRLPPTASVAATEDEGPHVSTRRDAFSIKVGLGRAEYALLGPRLWPHERRHLEAALRRDYGVEARAGAFTLLRRGAPTRDNAALLAALKPR